MSSVIPDTILLNFGILGMAEIFPEYYDDNLFIH